LGAHQNIVLNASAIFDDINASNCGDESSHVPDSTELIAMANQEWKNREERRGIHNREDWCCGWMAGFLSENKPNWRQEQIDAAGRRGYERALDDLGVLHGEDARKFNEELKNPSPLTPEAAEVMRKARELANDRTNPARFPTPLCQKCPVYLVGRGCIHELKYEECGVCEVHRCKTGRCPL
jgi:hypothetical protein